MKIRSVNFPTPVDIPGWSSGERYFRVHINGATGRTVRIANAICEFGGAYDNMAFGGSTHGSPHGYLSNTESPATVYLAPFDGLPATFWLSIGVGPSGWSPGFFELDLEIETGVGTNDFVALAESGVEYYTAVLGTPNIEEVGGPAPPAGCFWTDLFRVAQTGCEPAP